MADAGEFINRGAKKRTDLYFLNQTQMPAILLEICFVDSEKDAALYNEHFEEICDAIMVVIHRHGDETERTRSPSVVHGDRQVFVLRWAARRRSRQRRAASLSFTRSKTSRRFPSVSTRAALRGWLGGSTPTWTMSPAAGLHDHADRLAWPNRRWFGVKMVARRWRFRRCGRHRSTGRVVDCSPGVMEGWAEDRRCRRSYFPRSIKHSVDAIRRARLKPTTNDEDSCDRLASHRRGVDASRVRSH